MTILLPMKLTLQIKLLPSPEQQTSLLRTMVQFNAACDAIALVAFKEQLASKFPLHRIVYFNIKRDFSLSSQLIVRAIGKVVDAYKRDKTKLCAFKPHGAVIYDQRIMSFQGIEAVSLWTLDGRQLIPMVFGDYQKTQWHRHQGQADLVLVDNQFYLLATLDLPEPPAAPPVGFIGVDMGIVKIVVDSTGQEFSGQPVEKVRKQLHTLRKNLQKKHSKSSKQHLKKVRRREANYRKDVNHVISKKLVKKAKDTQSGIAIENLKGIRKRTTVRSIAHLAPQVVRLKSQRAKHHSWSFYQLGSFIEYKAKREGIPFVKVDARNTSRECSLCHHIDKKNRKTQAAFLCLNCGHSENADHNAAKVIAQRASVNKPIVVRPKLFPVQAPGITSRLL